MLASFECFLVEEGNLGADAGKERPIFLLLQISEEVDKLLGLSQTELATHDECLAGHIRGLVLRRQLSGERDEVGEEPSGLLEPVARISATRARSASSAGPCCGEHRSRC